MDFHYCRRPHAAVTPVAPSCRYRDGSPVQRLFFASPGKLRGARAACSRSHHRRFAEAASINLALMALHPSSNSTANTNSSNVVK